MLTSNLYSKVLLEPSKESNILYAVSGYASPAMVFRHFSDIPSNTTIHLIIGMTRREGIGRKTHELFFNMVNNEFNGRFYCYYVYDDKPVHSKMYAWFNDDIPVKGYVGSANYSQHAFLEVQNEILSEENPIEIKNYFESLLKYCIKINSKDIEKHIAIYDESNPNYLKLANTSKFKHITEDEEHNNYEEDLNITDNHSEFITLTLLTQRKDRMPEKSGLNWGQRPGREPNQAYIGLGSEIYRSDFFPPIGKVFTIVTDDGFSFECVRAQDNGKAIETPENNSLLGVYFRNRIGVRLGEFISMEDLNRYGRTDIKIFKINKNLYYMDFSV